MPQPKVSFGPSRSYTAMSAAGSSFFIRIERYSPAGPPPMIVTLIPKIVPSTQHSALVTLLWQYRKSVDRHSSSSADPGRVQDQSKLVHLQIRQSLPKLFQIQILNNVDPIIANQDPVTREDAPLVGYDLETHLVVASQENLLRSQPTRSSLAGAWPRAHELRSI